MSRPYALLSDLHFHSWSSFSTVNEEGINSRLQIIIDEVCRAKDELIKAGGDTMILGGDIFHTRGSISPEIMNPVIRLFENIVKDGITVIAIPGNHDLSSKNSQWLTNAASALIPAGVGMIDKADVFTLDDGRTVFMIPWHASVDELKKELSKHEGSYDDVIIHAPVDGVISGLPDHGLTDRYLASLEYERVFAGHYHNHRDFGNGVYSIGATTHQTWSDVGSKAGFLLVYPDRVQWFASHAPSFVDVHGDMDDEELMICDGNYVRVKIGKATPEEIGEIKNELLDLGAKGVVVQAVKETTIETRSATSSTAVSLEQSVTDYIAKAHSGNPELGKLCAEILTRVEAVDE
jgi:DNA repair exonuclease SbcCD nuclease subunit